MALPKQIQPLARFRFNEARKAVEKVGYETTERGDVEVRVKGGQYTVHLCTVANKDGYTFMPVSHIRELLLSRTLNRARRYCASSGRVTKHVARRNLLWHKRDDRMLSEGEYACYSLVLYTSTRLETEHWELTTFPYVTQQPSTHSEKYNTCSRAKAAAEAMERQLERNSGLL